MKESEIKKKEVFWTKWSAITMGSATIIMTIFVILTFYLSLIALSPQIATVGTLTCPRKFYAYEYSYLVKIPLRNIGNFPSRTEIKLKGENFNGTPIRNNFTMIQDRETSYSYQVNIENKTLKKATFYFEIEYYRPLQSMGFSITQTCEYEMNNASWNYLLLN